MASVPSLPSFIPADTRRARAKARTEGPGGSYKLAGESVKAAPARKAGLLPAGSGTQLRNRLQAEQKTGEVKRTGGGLFQVRDYSKGD